VLVELMARMGLRPGEAYALKVGKSHPMRHRLTIDEGLDGFAKTGESRELMLPRVLASWSRTSRGTATPRIPTRWCSPPTRAP
jgi:hypothetical protein